MDHRIYDYAHRLKVAQKRLKKARMLEGNRKSIEDYVRFRRANGLSIQRQCKCLYTLKLLGELACQKTFQDLTKEDMIDMFNQVRSKRNGNGEPKYKASIIRDFMVLWCGFIAWVHGIGDPRHEGRARMHRIIVLSACWLYSYALVTSAFSLLIPCHTTLYPSASRALVASFTPSASIVLTASERHSCPL